MWRLQELRHEVKHATAQLCFFPSVVAKVKGPDDRRTLTRTASLAGTSSTKRSSDQSEGLGT